MLLPRHEPSSLGPAADTRPVPPPSELPPSGLGFGGRRRSRQQQQTIDDPELRAELAEDLAFRPFAFLFHAARTLSVLGDGWAALTSELEAAGYREGIAMAAALGWLVTGAPPANVDDDRLPLWLAKLDQAWLIEAYRRRDGPEHSMSNCLIEVQLVDGSVGTMHARIDHGLGGTITNAFVVDDAIASIRQLFRTADRWRLGPSDRDLRPRPFRRIKPATAQRAVAGALASVDRADRTLDLNGPWPGNRALIAFLVNNPDLLPP